MRAVPKDEIWLLINLCNRGISLQCKAYQANGELVEVVKGQLRGIYGVVSVEIDRGELRYFADNTKEY